MVGLRWSGYYNGLDVVFGVLRRLPAVVWILRWLDCGGEGTTMAGLQMVGVRWLGYYGGWATVLRILRWLGCGGEGTMIFGLCW